MICNNQPKKLLSPDFFKVLEALNLREEIGVNCKDKFAIRKGSTKLSEKKEVDQIRTQSSYKKNPTQQAEIILPKTAMTSQTVKKVLECPPVTNLKREETLTTSEIKILESQYTKCATAYGSEKNLQKKH